MHELVLALAPVLALLLFVKTQATSQASSCLGIAARTHGIMYEARGVHSSCTVCHVRAGLPASREPSQNRPPHRQLQLDASQGPQQSHHLVEAQFAPIAPASPTPWTEDGIPTASCSDAGEGSKGKTDCAAVTRSSSGGAGPAECRVCLLADGEPGAGELVSPCHCAGSLRYVHMVRGVGTEWDGVAMALQGWVVLLPGPGAVAQCCSLSGPIVWYAKLLRIHLQSTASAWVQ